MWKWFDSNEFQSDVKQAVNVDGLFVGSSTIKFIFTTSDGLKSVGEWKDGERNGQGTITYPDGIKYVGEFKDGELWNGIFYEKNGNIIEKWVNGVKQ